MYKFASVWSLSGVPGSNSSGLLFLFEGGADDDRGVSMGEAPSLIPKQGDDRYEVEA